jgi:flagellar basal body-associated protein FliL
MAAKLAWKMRALKLLVIALGVLLLAGIGALAAAVVWRINHVNPNAPAKSAPPGVQRIVLPAGAKVIATDVGAGRLIVRIDIPGNGVRILVFDLATGAEVTTIELAPASP